MGLGRKKGNYNSSGMWGPQEKGTRTLGGEKEREGSGCKLEERKSGAIWSQMLYTFCQSSKEAKVPKFFNKNISSITSSHVVVN